MKSKGYWKEVVLSEEDVDVIADSLNRRDPSNPEEKRLIDLFNAASNSFTAVRVLIKFTLP